MSKKVSVIVATCKREKTLIKALESVANQSYKNLEIILIDDNADVEWNEKVGKIVEDFKTNNPTVEIIYFASLDNLGSAKARNKGIELSTGEYITFLDDDDVYLIEKVEKQVEFMIENALDFSVTNLELYYTNGKLAQRRVRDYIKSTDSKKLLEYHLMHNITGTDTMMFKAEYLRQIGGFAPINVGDEFYLMQRAIENGGKFGYLPRCDVHALIHTEDEGLSSGDGKIEGENRLYAYKKKYFDIVKGKQRRFIRMRHYAVLAFAEKRRKRIFAFFKNGVLSFLCAPIQCIGLLVKGTV